LKVDIEAFTSWKLILPRFWLANFLAHSQYITRNFSLLLRFSHLGKERSIQKEEGGWIDAVSSCKDASVAAGDDDELDGRLNSLGDSDEEFNFDDWMNTDLASDDELDGETSSPQSNVAN
jgi:hypothetical protein